MASPRPLTCSSSRARLRIDTWSSMLAAPLWHAGSAATAAVTSRTMDSHCISTAATTAAAETSAAAADGATIGESDSESESVGTVMVTSAARGATSSASAATPVRNSTHLM
jgi:hypothetical protein